MLNDTMTLTDSVGAKSFIRRAQVGSTSVFVPQGDTPANERKLRVAHEVTKSGTVNSLFAVSHLKTDPGNTAAAPRAAAVQIKIIRPSFVTDADMLLIVQQALSGLMGDATPDLTSAAAPGNVFALLNQEQ